MVLEDMGSTNGTYCNGARVTRQALSEGDKILLGSTTILKFTYQDQLDEAFQRQMSESALRDGLTRAYNKRYLTERIESELQYRASPRHAGVADLPRHRSLQAHQRRARPSGGRPRAGAAGDAGDEHARRRRGLRPLRRRGVRGHRARDGDWRRRRRCPNASAPASRRIRSCSATRPIPVTISVGVSRAPGLGIATTVDLVARADEALYAAKRGGRNRVCVAQAAPAAGHEAVKRAGVASARRSRAR